MAGPEFPAPSIAKYGITPAQYPTALKLIQENKEAVNLQVNGDSGSVSMEGVDFTWSYNGVDALFVTIVKVHSFKAKIAGNQAIFGILYDELLSKV